MFIRLLLLFTLLPIVELALLIKIGEHVGVIPTIILVASTGFLGVSLARSQGYKVITKIRDNLNAGKMPADELIGGLLILIGGTMLLTPGLLTDITGFTLIIPFSRKYYAQFIKRRISKYFEKKGFNINYQQYNNDYNFDDDYIDIDPDQTNND